MDSVGHKARSGSGRQPACRTCQKRRVRCDGLKVCTACLRRAAWEGLPPPERCEYASGVAPAEPSGSASASSSSSTDFSTRNCATTYPPVPYPPALPTSDYHSLFNEACSSLFIPPLALSTPLQSLDLTDIASPLSMYSSLPPGDPLKIDSSITGMDSTLTLPFAPNLGGEWSSGGPSEL
ncbi:hypothetical protein AAT19DRAFT_9858 [Rhodotorula toruloides]|uniref:Zn(2)-C6 fungal-type domain-containing protein n=1 Tax=Rhodotorula toruloides TaxID=5286 RepID=A0A2T0A182_RHOTO|nr:hypothetical protein AAT19DRAFT_9858 [Rhodotorula toruloides]